MDKKTVTFFIGSGCSFLTGQPSVSELTEKLLNQENYLIESMNPVIQTTTSNLPMWGERKDLGFPVTASHEELEPWRAPARDIQKFLTYLSENEFWESTPNYEDLAGVLNEVIHNFGQRNDPILRCFVDRVRLFEATDPIQFDPMHLHFQRMSDIGKLEIVEDFIGWVMAKNFKVMPNYSAMKACVRQLDF